MSYPFSSPEIHELLNARINYARELPLFPQYETHERRNEADARSIELLAMLAFASDRGFHVRHIDEGREIPQAILSFDPNRTQTVYEGRQCIAEAVVLPLDLAPDPEPIDFRFERPHPGYTKSLIRYIRWDKLDEEAILSRTEELRATQRRAK